MSNFWHKRNYSEVSSETEDLAKRGNVLLICATFDVTSPGTVAFALTTSSEPIQFAFYDISSSLHLMTAELIEAPTSYDATASSITPRNLHREFPDTTTVTLENATNIVGGTVIASEMIGSSIKAGGSLTMGAKIHTLRADETYIMSFTNLGNQTTKAHLNLGWVEGPIDPPSLVEAA
jgi:hypothetical protein